MDGEGNDGVSPDDMAGVLDAYNGLMAGFGLRERLSLEEFEYQAWGKAGPAHVCAVEVLGRDGTRPGRLLWRQAAATPGEARGLVLEQAAEKSGLPLAFSREEAELRLEAEGGVSSKRLRDVCRLIAFPGLAMLKTVPADPA